jgi:hypothetical protein
VIRKELKEEGKESRIKRIGKKKIRSGWKESEYTVKKGQRYSRPQPGMSLTKLSLARNNKSYSWPGRVVSDGKMTSLFLQYSWK